jgi:hypothetical protein
MEFDELALAIQGDVAVEGVARWDVHRERHSLDVSPLAAAHDPSYRPGRFVFGLPEWRGTFECEARLLRGDWNPTIGPFDANVPVTLRLQDGDEAEILLGSLSFTMGPDAQPLTYEFTGRPKVAAMREP